MTVYLDRQQHVIGYELLGIGGTSECPIDPVIMYREPWENTGEITLLDGTPAGIKISWCDKKTYVEIFAL